MIGRDHDADLLRTCHRAHLDALDTVLDVEAGLRDVLLHSQHAAQRDALDAVLDVESGLAAITPATSPTAVPDARKHSYPPASEQVMRLVSPQERFTLRRDADVLTASRVLDLILDLDRSLDRARNLVLDLARDIGLARDLGLDIDLALDHALDHALARANSLARDLALDHALAHALARALAFALALDRALARTRTRDDLTLDLARDLARDLTHDLARTRERTRGFVRQAIVRTGNAICTVLGRDVLLTEASVRPFLDDFTTADLRTAQLADIDLTGVRWSETETRWPEEVDIDALKSRSNEIEPGSGVYVIRKGEMVRDATDYG
jgi:hypothetical protein